MSIETTVLAVGGAVYINCVGDASSDISYWWESAQFYYLSNVVGKMTSIVGIPGCMYSLSH